MTTPTDHRSLRPVLLSSFVGSAIEFYDFLLYSLAASLVFGPLFFTDLTPAVATIASFATLAVGYVARPLGGVIFGHFGDRLGRKSMLVTTMTLMGVASFAIGLLPTQASIGMAAPLLLIFLRVLQGVAVGGEWAGAALMALEHAPDRNRGFAASFANMGGPAGAVLALVAVGLCSFLPDETFMAWGWRVPFLLSAVLVAVGLVIRLKVSESPVFVEAQRRAAAAPRKPRTPLVEVVTRYPRAVATAALGGIGAFTLQSVLFAFMLPFAIAAGHSRSEALWASAITSVLHVVTIPAFAALSDRVGRRPVMLAGAVATVALVHPVMLMIGTGHLGLLFLALLIGNPLLQAAMYGPFAAFVSEMFGAQARYTGASLGYQLSTTLGGGFAPLAASALLTARGDNDPLFVSLMMIGTTVVSALAILLAKESAAAAPSAVRVPVPGAHRGDVRPSESTSPAAL